MPVTLTLATPPAVLPVSLDEAKAHLWVDGPDEDALITRMLFGACRDAAAECGRGFGVGGYVLTLDDFPGCGDPVPLGVRPVVAVTAVRYRDAAGTLVTMAAGDYWLGEHTARLAPAAGYWPATQRGRPEAVAVEFQAGGPVDELGRDAVFLILADRFRHRGDGDADRRPIPAAARHLLWKLHTGEVA